MAFPAQILLGTESVEVDVNVRGVTEQRLDVQPVYETVRVSVAASVDGETRYRDSDGNLYKQAPVGSASGGNAALVPADD